MKELNENTLSGLSGGGDLPACVPTGTPSEAYIAAILALFAPSRAVHQSD